MKPKPKKLALWTQLPSARNRLEAAAASRLSSKAKLLADRRGKAAAKATERRLERSRLTRKRIRPVSKRKAAERKLYAAERDAWLAKWKDCWRCLEPKPLLELHHYRGRLGPLLRDQLYWMALCPACHRWVHENIEAARKRNLIAAAGEWNKA